MHQHLNREFSQCTLELTATKLLQTFFFQQLLHAFMCHAWPYSTLLIFFPLAGLFIRLQSFKACFRRNTMLAPFICNVVSRLCFSFVSRIGIQWFHDCCLSMVAFVVHSLPFEMALARFFCASVKLLYIYDKSHGVWWMKVKNGMVYNRTTTCHSHYLFIFCALCIFRISSWQHLLII